MTTVKRPINDCFSRLKGRLRVRVVDVATGLQVGPTRDVPNLVVDTGRELMAILGTAALTHVAVGTSNAPADPADGLPLVDQFLKTLATKTQEERTVIVEFEIAAGECNGLTIREFGLVARPAAGPDVLFARRVFSEGFVKTVDISIQGIWTITF